MRGKFGEHQTVRSILKSLPESAHSDAIRAGIGDDYARLLLREGDSINVATGSISSNTFADMKLDVARLYNSIRIGGYIPWAATNMIVMPDDNERVMKRLLGSLADICAGYGIDIIAGHTEVNSGVKEPIISVTVLGKKFPDGTKSYKIRETYAGRNAVDIVMCGQTGMGGTLSRYCNNKEKLHARYSESYLHPVMELFNMITLDEQVDIAMEHGIRYAHDISRGGVYAALWEMGDALSSGLTVRHDDIPILQETIEICEYIGENPYMIDGCGAAIFVCRKGSVLAEKLYNAGYEAAVIGHLTDSGDRVIIHDDEQRYLTPPRYI